MQTPPNNKLTETPLYSSKALPYIPTVGASTVTHKTRAVRSTAYSASPNGDYGSSSTPLSYKFIPSPHGASNAWSPSPSVSIPDATSILQSFTSDTRTPESDELASTCSASSHPAAPADPVIEGHPDIPIATVTITESATTVPSLPQKRTLVAFSSTASVSTDNLDETPTLLMNATSNDLDGILANEGTGEVSQNNSSFSDQESIYSETSKTAEIGKKVIASAVPVAIALVLLVFVFFIAFKRKRNRYWLRQHGTTRSVYAQRLNISTESITGDDSYGIGLHSRNTGTSNLAKLPYALRPAYTPPSSEVQELRSDNAPERIQSNVNPLVANALQTALAKPGEKRKLDDKFNLNRNTTPREQKLMYPMTSPYCGSEKVSQTAEIDSFYFSNERMPTVKMVDIESLSTHAASTVRVVSGQSPRLRSGMKVNQNAPNVRVAFAETVNTANMKVIDRMLLRGRVLKARLLAEPPPLVEVELSNEENSESTGSTAPRHHQLEFAMPASQIRKKLSHEAKEVNDAKRSRTRSRSVRKEFAPARPSCYFAGQNNKGKGSMNTVPGSIQTEIPNAKERKARKRS
eukprot:gb/GECG01001729.1/.p1 GENE.gb/GECG01001729.1/~~gb/GECG01001729.1/.p1  ORF type:complete len:576 (+),score=64.35 gb/GECG01001729.1/:1-1728(+)